MANASRARMEPHSTAIELAPAAGAGIGRKVAENLLARPDFVEDLANAALNGLKATTRHFDKETRTFEEVPDFKTQLQAFVAILAHLEGDPIKRVIHTRADGPQLDPLQALQDSPALRDRARHLLEKAEFRTRKAKPLKQALPTVDVDT